MKFLDEQPLSIVPPVLLSGRNAWVYKPNEPGSALGNLEVSDAAAIVDGQHRMGGFVALFEKKDSVREVPFILLDDLTLDEEKQEFVVVNNSQKGVPKSLTAYLENSEEAQIAWRLNEDPDSPFHGHIARATKTKQTLFNLHSVAKQIKELFKLPPLDELDIDTKVEFTEKFFTIVSDTLPDEWADMDKLEKQDTKGPKEFQYKLLELTGLIAWTVVGAMILHRSFTVDAGMNWQNVERLVSHAAGIDWDKDGQYAGRTGTAGGKVLSDDMMRLLPAEGGELEEA
jgi:DNA sulfur modification protein DndB